MRIIDLGWDSHWDERFAPYRARGLEPARVVLAERDRCQVTGDAGSFAAEVSGRFRHQASVPADFPAVGDWVAIEARPDGGATIHAVLPRRSRLSRNAAGDRTEEQMLAANVDIVFLISGLDGDFNPRRIERHLTSVWESGAVPVVVLNKSDLCDDPDSRVAEIQQIAAGVPVLPVSAQTGSGLEGLAEHLLPYRTAVLLGSSGVGKSTLVNALLGAERQRIGAVRESDSRGRHTTSNRELLVLPGGALLVDGPGLRELQLWADPSGADATFGDVETLARTCRFRDCVHATEPGCAVQAAIEAGTLAPQRFASWQKLQRELLAFAARHDQQVRLAQKRRWKVIGKALRARPKKRP